MLLQPTRQACSVGGAAIAGRAPPPRDARLYIA
jgi:hypothetical protein